MDVILLVLFVILAFVVLIGVAKRKADWSNIVSERLKNLAENIGLHPVYPKKGLFRGPRSTLEGIYKGRKMNLEICESKNGEYSGLRTEITLGCANPGNILLSIKNKKSSKGFHEFAGKPHIRSGNLSFDDLLKLQSNNPEEAKKIFGKDQLIKVLDLWKIAGKGQMISLENNELKYEEEHPSFSNNVLDSAETALETLYVIAANLDKQADEKYNASLSFWDESGKETVNPGNQIEAPERG